MKTKLLGLVTLVSLLGLSAAHATTIYTYTIDKLTVGSSPNATTVGGYIDTNCNACYLTPCDITSWDVTLTPNGTGGFTGSFSGDATDVSQVLPYSTSEPNLEVSNGVLYVIQSSFQSGVSTDFSSSTFDLDFNPGYCEVTHSGSASQTDCAISAAIGELTLTTTQSTTPLPAALPLFVGGLSVMGLLGWRRKRKAQAVAV